jgi:hypothetical protein
VYLLTVILLLLYIAHDFITKLCKNNSKKEHNIKVNVIGKVISNDIFSDIQLIIHLHEQYHVSTLYVSTYSSLLRTISISLNTVLNLINTEIHSSYLPH